MCLSCSPGGIFVKTNFSDHSLAQLTVVRFREFMREPEALFWVFLFPILLAAGLGLAFRNRPAEVLKVGAVTPEITRSLRQEKLLDVQELDMPAADAALRAVLSIGTTTPIQRGELPGCWRIVRFSGWLVAWIRWRLKTS